MKQSRKLFRSPMRPSRSPSVSSVGSMDEVRSNHEEVEIDLTSEEDETPHKRKREDEGKIQAKMPTIKKLLDTSRVIDKNEVLNTPQEGNINAFFKVPESGTTSKSTEDALKRVLKAITSSVVELGTVVSEQTNTHKKVKELTKRLQRHVQDLGGLGIDKWIKNMHTEINAARQSIEGDKIEEAITD